MNLELEIEQLEILQKRLNESQRVVDLIKKVIYNEYNVHMTFDEFVEENKFLNKEVEWQKQILKK